MTDLALGTPITWPFQMSDPSDPSDLSDSPPAPTPQPPSRPPPITGH